MNEQVGENLNLRIWSLFSGIGGLELGLEWAGLGRTYVQCEIEEFPRSILERHWPNAVRIEDVHDIKRARGPLPVPRADADRWLPGAPTVQLSTGRILPKPDIICGGFPCQPTSLAGRGLAQEDPRWLWPEFERIISEFRPTFVIAENPPGLRRRGLADVLGGLADCGYDAEWVRLSAAAVGAPHLRERFFIVGYPMADSGGERRQQVSGGTHADEAANARRAAEEDHVSDGTAQGNREGDGARSGMAPNPDSDRARQRAESQRDSGAERGRGSSSSGSPGSDSDGVGQTVADASGERLEGRVFTEAARAALPIPPAHTWWRSEPDVGRVAHGIPHRVGRLKALGNAVVPQCALFVGLCLRNAIEEGRFADVGVS